MIKYIMLVIVINSPTELTPVAREVSSCKVANQVASILEKDKEKAKILDYSVMCAPFNHAYYQET